VALQIDPRMFVTASHRVLSASSAAYQKLMKLVNEQFEGSVERFLSASLAHVELPEKPSKKDTFNASRKPALTKWKRLR
jgi:hypothetical protein